jgi:cell shape-determining protein MreC
MASRTAFLIASIVIACVCADARVDTQTQSQDVTAALLTEVRALRATIALAVGTGASGQLALGRLQLQEQRVNALVTRLDTTREKLGESQREALQRRESCKSIETALTSPATSHSVHSDYTPSREDLEQMMTTCRAETAAAVSETQRLIAEEAVLAADLLTEQSRWSDLNRRLEEIELVLSRSQ